MPTPPQSVSPNSPAARFKRGLEKGRVSRSQAPLLSTLWRGPRPPNRRVLNALSRASASSEPATTQPGAKATKGDAKAGKPMVDTFDEVTARVANERKLIAAVMSILKSSEYSSAVKVSLSLGMLNESRDLLTRDLATRLLETAFSALERQEIEPNHLVIVSKLLRSYNVFALPESEFIIRAGGYDDDDVRSEAYLHEHAKAEVSASVKPKAQQAAASGSVHGSAEEMIAAIIEFAKANDQRAMIDCIGVHKAFLRAEFVDNLVDTALKAVRAKTLGVDKFLIIARGLRANGCFASVKSQYMMDRIGYSDFSGNREMLDEATNHLYLDSIVD